MVVYNLNIRKSILFFLVFICLNLKTFGQLRFENVAKISHIKHVHTSVVYMGGGVAFFDFNNDGLDDIYLTGGNKTDRLYKNVGNLKFEDVTAEFGLLRATHEQSMSVSIGDINNDGFKDIFVTYGSGETNRLYLNIEGSYFMNITNSSGLFNLDWSMGATFGDVNNDGFVDLYVINWVKKFGAIKDESGNTIGFSHEGTPNNLYINNGDNTFSEVSESYNADHNGCGLAVMMTDYNNDANPDIYIADDFGEWVKPNALLKNEFPSPTYSDESLSSGLDASIYGMGIAAGDFDRDGHIDYYTTNIGRNILFKNKGDDVFEDVTTMSGVENSKAGNLNTTSWGAVFTDIDNDGYEDLLVSNGYIPAAQFIATAEEDPNKLYLNNQDGTFIDITDDNNLGDLGISRGVAVSDLDNDGDLDFLFTILDTDISNTQSTGNILLYENKSVNTNHFVKFKLEGSVSNRDAYNSRVNVFCNSDKYIRELYSSSSHCSQNSSIIHFGLGKNTVIDSVIIVWSGGKKETIKDLEVDQTYYILEGEEKGKILGCTNPMSNNYNPKAEIDFGCIENTLITAYEHKDKEDGYSFLYPNPCEFNLFFRPSRFMKDPIQINILSGTGKVISEQVVRLNAEIDAYQIDISTLEKGLYILKYKNEFQRFFKD
ncbi:MAG TPA: FG-GAP-like repeat-containing protein [Fulvivirga sp.]|nr:FG-GAP-like repeat-containing protein [Fulvivirga sp.]